MPNRFESLLDESIARANAPRPPRAPFNPRRALVSLGRAIALRAASLWRRRAVRVASTVIAGIGALGAGMGLFLAIRPVPRPDYESDRISALFNYTLLTDEFNRLPVEDRIDLIAQLYERVRGMDAAESALMASFFAGVAGEARDQIRENAARLMLDATDLVAKDYAKVPPEQRAEYLDQAFVKLVRLASPFDGDIEERTDDELLAEARENAKRDQQAVERGDVSARDASRMMVFMNENVRSQASGHQQARLTLFMRDLTRRLRGQPLDGG